MATSLRVKWREVTQPAGAPVARSSHAVAVVGKKAYVFGGEFEPRVPLDNDVHVFDLETQQWCVMETSGDKPSPRVGVGMAAVDSIVYIFAGRNKDHEELNEFYALDTTNGVWKLLSSGSESPPHRSYHAVAAHEHRKQVFTFGGCGKNGRLNDLWCFDIANGVWEQLPSPTPESNLIPRGGPGLVAVRDHVWIIFGFCGHELSDIHRFNLDEQTWEEVQCTGEKPTGRSVFGTATIGSKIVLYGGEVDPSDQGHMGAGAFSSEVLVLDAYHLSWSRPDVSVEGERDPGARGWYAAAAFGNSMLVYGGNSDSNDRLDDIFVLSLEE
ncbi:thiohydroximate-O-sulfate sulfur/sulfate-lyase (nitrile-forming) NSP2 [Physcomitrium patens]|uniref:Nitrile-specifier protein 5 n=2 Tax=Physcomitrium patens TaxID=3218 RepID=A9TGB9_PHYPA|nr:nitrile-specifier protein 5-like [Physcomitrium patens]PNR39699.1 hypothetical protein PHYPA_019978 [Physcomitrium patens]|eukprot:XP_024397417.1 nitrile-specifier protein 5-like [Physcomitrella patens]